jgi:hypothetical protein
VEAPCITVWITQIWIIPISYQSNGENRHKWENAPINCEIWDSHGDEDVDVLVLGCDDVWTRRQIPTFQRNLLSPSSALKRQCVSPKAWYLPTSPHAVTTQKNNIDISINCFPYCGTKCYASTEIPTLIEAWCFRYLKRQWIWQLINVIILLN